MRLVCYLTGSLLLLCAPGFAQTLGEITGEISDSSGAVVSGAAVTAVNHATNATRSGVTNSAGVYDLPALQPGTYSLKVEKTGFKTASRAGIELQVQQTVRVDATLEVGQLSESVEVAASTTMLATENATVGTVIENRRIVELPLNGRNYLQLISLSPNVSAGFASAGQAGSRQGGDRSSQQISIAGQRREFNYYTLDGIDNTDVNFNTYIFLPSIDALQEFKVQTGIYPAEFGRETSQVNVSTKPGSNEYHGSVYEFLRNSSLDARPYAFTSRVPAKAPFKLNEYGFTLGGPVAIPKLFNGHDRLFFLSNFEGYKNRTQGQGLYSTAPDAMRAGDFSQLLPKTVVNDPLSGAPFPGNIIPTGRINPVSRKLFEFFPPPNIAGAGLTNNYLALDNNSTDKDQFTQRVDWVEGSNSSWFARYSWTNEQAISPALKLNGTNLATRAYQAVLSNTRVFGPNKVNEFRFGFNHFFNNFGRELANKRDVVKELGIPGLSDPPPDAWGIPAVSILGFSGFGDDSEGPYVNRNYTFEWNDGFSWSVGKHSLKFGGQIRRDRYNQLGNQFARGSFIVENQATGYGFADFLLGYTRRNEDAVALAITQFRATSQAYFADDTWKVTSKLTLSLGLRYEYTPPWANRGNSLMNAYVPFIDMTPNVADPNRHPTLIRIGSGDIYQDTLLRFNPAIKIARDGRMGGRLINDDKRNFAPRLGIAWSPTNRWTVRAGFGMFYTQDTGNPRFDMGRNLSGRLRSEANTQTHNLTFQQPFSGSVNPCGVQPPLTCISTPYVLGNMYDRTTPYTEEYLLNVQRALTNSLALEFGYLGSQSHRLERMFAYNEAIPGASGSVVSRTPYPEFGRIQEVGNMADANYHSLELKLTKRYGNGLTLLAGYTWSKAIDNGSGIRVLGSDSLFPQNSYCFKCERGLSVFDTRNRFVTSLLYELPVGKGHAFLDHGIGNVVLGGWQMGSIVTASSGFPLNVYAGSDRSNIGAGFDRPNASGQPVALGSGTRGPNAWFNIAGFALQPLGTFGNVGRNSLIGPGFVTWDFSALKNFYFLESRYLQFRLEGFNLANHANWGDPNTTLLSNRLDSSGVPIAGTGGFGQINSTRIAMRQLQFALKVVF